LQTIVDQEIARLCDEVRDFAEHFFGKLRRTGKSETSPSIFLENYGELGYLETTRLFYDNRHNNR
jgi:hypothetical protein